MTDRIRVQHQMAASTTTTPSTSTVSTAPTDGTNRSETSENPQFDRDHYHSPRICPILNNWRKRYTLLDDAKVEIIRVVVAALPHSRQIEPKEDDRALLLSNLKAPTAPPRPGDESRDLALPLFSLTRYAVEERKR